MDDERARGLDEASSSDLVLEEGAVLARKYRLTRRAGFGGMAQLWVATNEATGAEVCVKILIPGSEDHESVERFRREAYAAARLSHRAIVRIFDLLELGADGETTTGRPSVLAIVMELLHGETLGDMLLKRGKLEVEATIDLALPFLSALAHAHRAGVVHRDLKPDNIFLSTDPDGHVIPKVLDFGVSKMGTGGDRSVRPVSGSQPLTLDGVMLGTPGFMSPEQARGSREIDARSDVFSAGILMYVMLAGENPFESENFHSVVSAIIQREPPRLRAVPDAIWNVIAKSLAKDPAARYADATELGIALKRASGRTSTTESGPQSADVGTASARVIVTPLGGDSIVTVPPVGNAELGDTPGESAARSALPASRRRAVRIVMAVVGASLVLIVVALVRRSPAGTTGATSAASATSALVSPSAASGAGSITATDTATATAKSVVPAIAVADAGAVKAAPKAPASAKAPAGAVKKPPDAKGPSWEPSIVRDPGF